MECGQCGLGEGGRGARWQANQESTDPGPQTSPAPSRKMTQTEPLGKTWGWGTLTEEIGRLGKTGDLVVRQSFQRRAVLEVRALESSPLLLPQVNQRAHAHTHTHTHAHTRNSPSS